MGNAALPMIFIIGSLSLFLCLSLSFSVYLSLSLFLCLSLTRSLSLSISLSLSLSLYYLSHSFFPSASLENACSSKIGDIILAAAVPSLAPSHLYSRYLLKFY